MFHWFMLGIMIKKGESILFYSLILLYKITTYKKPENTSFDFNVNYIFNSIKS